MFKIAGKLPKSVQKNGMDDKRFWEAQKKLSEPVLALVVLRPSKSTTVFEEEFETIELTMAIDVIEPVDLSGPESKTWWKLIEKARKNRLGQEVLAFDDDFHVADDPQ